MSWRPWGLLAIVLLIIFCRASGVADAAESISLPATWVVGDDLAQQAAAALGAVTVSHAGIETNNNGRLGQITVRGVEATDGDLVVCVDAAIDDLAVGGWLGMEELQTTVRDLLAELSWRSLSVQVWDADGGACYPLSDFAPRTTPQPTTSGVLPDGQLAAIGNTVTASATALDQSASLSGKTVYVSAGHGWYWNGSQWRTQRPPYQDIIEDHNNAEAVTQFLLPYLENAGATVVPMRERDWSAHAAIADNDGSTSDFAETGVWFTGISGASYADGTYQYAISTAGAPNATATWFLDVPDAGEFAVYAWVFPGTNRVPDAHYTIHHAGGTTEVTLNQRVFPNTWRYLGTFPFYAGPAMVELDNRTSSGGSYAVIADAIRIGGGTFDSLSDIPALTTLPVDPDSPAPLPSDAPAKPWWETSTFYWSQWVGLDPYQWSYFNDVVARPLFARWYQRQNSADAVYVSWHTNGYNGNNTTVRGTVSYVHNGDTYPRTDGSLELQAAVHSELVHDIQVGWDSSWTDRGTRELNLGELRMLWDSTAPAASLPGVLLEIAYHDNSEDARALKDPEFNRLAARAVYQGIVKYFEAKDGTDLMLSPEPPTYLLVLNAGDGTLSVSWRPSPTDDLDLQGEAATGYYVYTSPDGLAWGQPQVVWETQATLAGYSQGQEVYVKVTGFNAGGESLASEVLGARVGTPRILVVSAFDKLNHTGLVFENDPVEHENLRMWVDQMNSRDYVVHHGSAIPQAEAWDSASNEAVVAGSVQLEDYDVVDWILGEETTAVDGTLNASERALLATYLDLDRALLISGAELGWELVELGVAPDFLGNTLHTAYVADDADTTRVRPEPSGALAGVGDLNFDAADGYAVGYPDVFSPLVGAQTAMEYVGGSGDGQSAAVQYADGCQRLLVLGFPFETLRMEQRAEVMDKAVDFLGTCVHADTYIDVPEDQAAYSALPAFSGSAVGTDLKTVWLQLTRWSSSAMTDGVYWSGSAWNSTPTWFPASGAGTWSYEPPALSEGRYSLSAYAEASGVDRTSVEATFMIDWTPPAIPTVITPTRGVTITGPTVNFDWTNPVDVGSAVHFDLEIDSSVVSATNSPYRMVPSLGPGSHSWRLRAVDSAGNASEWTEWAEFGVVVEQVFLPSILRE